MTLRLDRQIGNPTHSVKAGSPPKPTFSSRNGHLNLDTFSPVNENGSFAFDQVLKRGKVMRRSTHNHAFKSSWKPGYLVLRPNLLSLYKDVEEAELQLSIDLSDVTAVALVKAAKSKRQHVFGIFSPSKNYRFQAVSEVDAESWVDRIRNESCSDDADSLGGYDITENKKAREAVESMSETDCDGHKTTQHRAPSIRSGNQQAQQLSQDYSGNEIASCSDFSDAIGSITPRRSTVSLPPHDRNSLSSSAPPDHHPSLPRNTSQFIDGALGNLDPERVICHGYLLCLKSKKGVRQWKKLWVVLRPQNICFYKDEQEYAAVKIISMLQVINAAEIDPISRSKKFCLQIIAEDKTYRFCALDEEALAKWLGALKSLLVKRHGSTSRHTAGPAIAGPS
ncbi:PH domain-containing protein [Histoplasma capsulatum G186AR]|uniref:PH domain-containing protein n=2 Tax=Ajellomyces capsulatus TaxID=5037 RepID=C0NFN9_AJECG|nr:PH domain-containing protein [Histoplasma capsulatum G186AR]EEH10060.1 PH domain-containing protein [Histoplasma capsulatum G186AR]KAG5290990.1 PH domain-containing protein [Histoplasma capsulatum]QSS72918.1 PH domain-containing protein [Histoplasma capsulatum G186AR]